MIGLREIQDSPVADKNALTYSEPTIIQIKSLKHTALDAVFASIQIEAPHDMLRTEDMCHKRPH